MVNLSNFRPRACQVIPDGWEAHHKPTMDQTRTAVVEIWSGPSQGEKKWVTDPVSGREVLNHGIRLYSHLIVTARVQRLLSEEEQTAAAQDTTSRRHLVTLDREIAAGLTTRARLLVSECTDPILQDKYLYVQDIQTGSLRWERDVYCTENL